MSQENVEVVKEFSQLFAAGDRENWREYFDPDLIWDASASGLPWAGVYRGHGGVERFFRDWLGAWRDYEIAYTDFIDAGDAVVVFFRQAGTGRGSGVRTEKDFFNVFDLRDSKVVRCRLFESREQALEAAGVSE
jgi:uncharacterized protein